MTCNVKHRLWCLSWVRPNPREQLLHLCSEGLSGVGGCMREGGQCRRLPSGAGVGGGPARGLQALRGH